MRIKSFFAPSIEEALEQAQRELGPEAMLIQSRPAPPDARALGEYEVVCALLAGDASKGTALASQEGKGAESGAGSSFDRLTDEIDALRGVVERLQSSLIRSQPMFAGSRLGAGFETIWTAMLAADVDPELARELISRAAETAGESLENLPATSPTARELVHRQLASAIDVRPFSAPEAGKQTIAALVGPPGAGKTACIAKIAARFGVAAGRTTEIIALDEHRIAASDQLRTYAAILGTGFRTVTRLDELSPVLEQARWRELVLIDTPGFSFSEADACQDLARALAAQASIETHLVLPCSLRSGDLRRIADFYEPFNASGLIFTRLDETQARGAIVNEAVRATRAITFTAAGPRIPDDLDPATPERIADLVLGEHASRQRAASAGM